MSEKSIKYVDTQEGILECAEHISKHEVISFDLEFDRNRYRYGFTLCLMQIMAGDTCYLIDPLPDAVNLRPVFDVIESPHILKTVFSAKEDLELLHILGCHPVNMYDSGKAIRLLDFQQSSLAVVLEHFLGVTVDKESQTSNWFTRPLSDAQHNYAAMDVFHLIPLMEKVKELAKEMGRSHWISEENRLLQERDFSAIDNGLLYSEKDKKDLNEVQWHVYCRLLKYREEKAEELDVPPGRLLHKEYIKEILLSNGMRYWEKNRRTHKKFRNAESKRETLALLKRWENEAIDSGLSKEKNARKKLSREEYQQFKVARIEKEEFLDNVVKPLKRSLTEMVGEHASSFILSNRVAGDMKSDSSIVLPEYRRRLIAEAAKKVDLEEAAMAVFGAS